MSSSVGLALPNASLSDSPVSVKTSGQALTHLPFSQESNKRAPHAAHAQGMLRKKVACEWCEGCWTELRIPRGGKQEVRECVCV